MYLSKTSPVSEDKWIDLFVKSMEGQLIPIWGVNTSEVKFYGRSNIIEDKDHWYSEGNEIDILADTAFKFISFVRVDPNVTFLSGRHRVNATLVCQGKLDQLYSNVDHRADAELRKDVVDLLFKHLDNETNYSGYNIIDQSENKDMQPFHTCELNFIITY